MSSKGKITKNYQAFLWIILPLAAVTVFGLYPAVSAIIRSFMKWTPIQSEWVWFANYKELFQDKLFSRAFKNMVILALSSLVTSNVMTLLLAEFLFNLKLKKLEKSFHAAFGNSIIPCTSISLPSTSAKIISLDE